MSEEWHKTHAVLLKSVAEAQGKLLAGIDALETKLTAMQGEQGKNQLKADLAHETVVHEIGQIRSMFIDCAVSKGDLKDMEKRLMGAIVHKRASTKRKPRGRR
jgi:hypothetical protein